MRTALPTVALAALFAGLAAVPAAADPAASPATTDPAARRDPFSSLFHRMTPTPTGCEQHGPLSCATFEKLEVIGVVTGTATPRALVRNSADGLSSTVKVGDVIGSGRVTAIRRTGVVVEREFRDAIGKRTTTRTVLELGGGRFDA
jgi:Tfp pilus assembly protein PilP